VDLGFRVLGFRVEVVVVVVVCVGRHGDSAEALRGRGMMVSGYKPCKRSSFSRPPVLLKAG
jgi:hypothetical protein